MKKYILCFLFMPAIFIASSEPENHDHVTITKFCEKYHKRSYFILRLEQIIEMIKKFDSKPFTFRFNHDQFNNSLVLQCIEEIEKTNSLEPFYKLWKNTRRYKYLEDESFALDVTRLIFTIQHTIYSYMKQSLRHNHNSFDIELHLDCLTYTEAITIRKYHGKRLAETYAFLATVKCSERSLFEEKHEGCDCTFITHYEFTNKAISECIKKMEQQKNLKPLLALYKEFISYKLIQNDVFLREFTALTFIVTRNIFLQNISLHPNPSQKRCRNHVAHIYENLDKIPIEEILEAIDLLNNELPEILDQYEFNSDMSWKEWLKKYWWIPPVVGIIMGLRIREIMYPIASTDKGDPDKAQRAVQNAGRLAEALLSRNGKGGSVDTRKSKASPQAASKRRIREQVARMREIARRKKAASAAQSVAQSENSDTESDDASVDRALNESGENSAPLPRWKQRPNLSRNSLHPSSADTADQSIDPLDDFDQHGNSH